jgi:5'-3' exonuclease
MVEQQFEDEAPAPAGDVTQLVEVVDKPKGADVCLVVDVSNLAYRSFHAYSSLTTATGKLSGHVYGSVRLLLATLRNYLDPGKCCIAYCYDGAGAKKLRQQVLPEYKAGRDDGRFNPCPEVKDALQWLPGLHIEQAEREGDDAMAWITEKLAASGQKVVLLTGDRDLWQLKRLPSVQVYSPNLKRYVIPDDITKEYFVTDPGRIPLAKALFGDSSDGIKGVDRLQRKMVAPILNRADVTDPGSFCSALAAEPARKGDRATGDPGLTETAKQKVAASSSAIVRNYAVILPKLDGFGPASVRHVPLTSAARQQTEGFLLSYDCVALVGMLDAVFGARP